VSLVLSNSRTYQEPSALKEKLDRTMAKKMIKVTQVKSVNGRLQNHKACVAGLGLRRIGHSVEVEDTPSVRGMINKVNYLVKVEGE
jgi:large subunit ribosomal protein L30